MSIYVQRISSLTSHLESPCANLIVYLWRFEGILPQSTRNIWRVVTAVHRSSGPFLLVIIDSGVMAVWVTARETHDQRWCWFATSTCSWCACNIGSSGSSDSLFAGHLRRVRVLSATCVLFILSNFLVEVWTLWCGWFYGYTLLMNYLV